MRHSWLCGPLDHQHQGYDHQERSNQRYLLSRNHLPLPALRLLHLLRQEVQRNPSPKQIMRVRLHQGDVRQCRQENLRPLEEDAREGFNPKDLGRDGPEASLFHRRDGDRVLGEHHLQRDDQR